MIKTRQGRICSHMTSVFPGKKREQKKKKNLTFKINANQLENHLVPINEHSVLSQAI